MSVAEGTGRVVPVLRAEQKVLQRRGERMGVLPGGTLALGAEWVLGGMVESWRDGWVLWCPCEGCGRT